MSMLALRKTTTSVLSTVSASADAITHTATAISALAETGSAHAEAYRDASISDLKLDAESRKARRIHQMAQSDASFYVELDSAMDKSPEFTKYFEEAKARYTSAEKAK